MSVEITYFVHSTTTDNEAGLASGWNDVALSETGKRQAAELRDKTQQYNFDVIFTSDLTRAVTSAAITWGDRYPIIQDARLRECNYGDLNGKPKAAFPGTLHEYVDASHPNGESYKEVEARLANFVAFLREHYDGKRVAIVGHQGPQLALDVLLKGKTWQQAIDEDWRITKAWQPGWHYTID